MSTATLVITQPDPLNAACSITTVCVGGVRTISVLATGGTPPYSYQWMINGLPVAGSTNSKTVSCYTSGSATVTVHDANWDPLHPDAACEAFCAQPYDVLLPPVFCALTQGGWGNSGGQFNGVGRTALINSLITPSTPLTIGVVGYRSITFTSTAAPGVATCILARMPAGGTPDAFPVGFGNQIVTFNGTSCSSLPSSILKNNGRFNNTYIGQVLALSLNTRLICSCGPYGGLGGLALTPVICTQSILPGPDGLKGTADDMPNPGPDGIIGTLDDPIQVHTISNTILTALSNLSLPATVNGLLELANRALAGLPLGGATVGDLNTAVTTINETFDECMAKIDCPPPQVVQKTNRTYCHNDAAPSISFSDPIYGNAATINWTSSVNVGFGILGVGNIPGFTANNPGIAPAIGVVSVTSTAYGFAPGPAMNFMVTVNPRPTVNAITNLVYANGASAPSITFSSPTAGVTFNWTSSVNVGFNTSGSGNIAPFTALNGGATPVVATVTVRATFAGCQGPPTTFTVTVNPGTPKQNFSASAPTGYTLYDNHPNPFNPSTTIEYFVPEESNVRLSVYNLLGNEVAVLVDGAVASGRHSVVWNAASNGHGDLPAGVYIYRLHAASLSSDKSFKSEKRMVLVK